MDEDMDFDSKLFPNTSPIFWKILLRKTTEFKATLSKRRSLAATKKLDTSKFKGVRVRSDNAVVTLGKSQDVQLVRTGAVEAMTFEIFRESAIQSPLGQ